MGNNISGWFTLEPEQYSLNAGKPCLQSKGRKTTLATWGTAATSTGDAVEQRIVLHKLKCPWANRSAAQSLRRIEASWLSADSCEMAGLSPGHQREDRQESATKAVAESSTTRRSKQPPTVEKCKGPSQLSSSRKLRTAGRQADVTQRVFS